MATSKEQFRYRSLMGTATPMLSVAMAAGHSNRVWPHRQPANAEIMSTVIAVKTRLDDALADRRSTWLRASRRGGGVEGLLQQRRDSSIG